MATLVNIDLNFQQAVKNIVMQRFPATHPDSERAKILDKTFGSTAESTTLLDDATGERLFTFGISRWGGRRAVGA